MAITYHAGRRIQGLSSDILNLTQTFDDDLTSSTNWNGLSGAFSYDSTNDEIDYNCDTSLSTAYWNLGSTLNSDEWIFRTKLDIDTFSATSANIQQLNITLSDGTGNRSATQDSIGFMIRIDSAGSKFQTQWGNNQTLASNTSNFTTTPSTGTYYVEIKRTSSSTFTVTLYSDSSYSGTPTETKDITGVTATSLQYVKLATYSEATNNNLVGSVDDIKIYDGVSSITNKPSNVQLGSRYEETDTRKMYNLSDVSKTDCLVYYNFEQTSGSLTNIATTGNGFSDGLGSSADGTNNGATTTITGKVGSYAWEFDNTSHTTGDRVTLGGTSTIGTLSTGTISAWIKNDAPSRAAQHIIFSASDSGDASSEFAWGVLSDQLFLIARENGTPVVSNLSGGTINSGTWYHAVITFDSTGTEMFLDGQSVATTTSVSPSSINDVDLITLGSNVDSSGAQWGFDGLIDEVSIWNRVLTDNEISVLYNSGTGTPVDNAKAWQEIGA